MLLPTGFCQHIRSVAMFVTFRDVICELVYTGEGGYVNKEVQESHTCSYEKEEVGLD